MSYGMIWYLLSILDGVDHGLEGLAFASTFSFSCCVVFGFIQDEIGAEFKKHRKLTGIFMVIFVTLHTIIPSKKDAMIILGLNMAQTPIEQITEDLGSAYPEVKQLIKKEFKEMLGDDTENKSN